MEGTDYAFPHISIEIKFSVGKTWYSNYNEFTTSWTKKFIEATWNEPFDGGNMFLKRRLI